MTDGLQVRHAAQNFPQTLNLYAYAGNNPVTNIDPDGHQVGMLDGMNLIDPMTGSVIGGQVQAEMRANEQANEWGYAFGVAMTYTSSLLAGDYTSERDAAIAAVSAAFKLSQTTGWEWGGRIFQKSDDFSFTAPRTDKSDAEVNEGASPQGTRDVAGYHTHVHYPGEIGDASQQFSGQDIVNAIAEQKRQYLGLDAGILVWDPAHVRPGYGGEWVTPW